MPQTTPTLAELDRQTQADIATRVAGSTPSLRRSILGAIGKALSGALFGLYGFLRERSRQCTPYDATGVDLERWASVWSVSRKQPTTAAGSVVATGASGVAIPSGTELQSSGGIGYRTTALATTAAGTATIPVVATDSGSNGNVATGSVLSWVNPPAGLAATVTVAAGGVIGGASLESDDGLRARMLQRIRAPGHGGNEDDYRNWALEVGAITRAWPFPLYSGAGTVRVYVANDDYVGANLASGGDVATAQAYLDARKPVTATVTAVAPTATPVDFGLTIVPDTPENRLAVTAALAELFFREAVPEAGISLNRLISTIGSSGIDDFTMASPSVAPTAPAGAILTLGDITW